MFRSPPGYLRGMYWVFCTLTTSRKISNHKLDSLLMIPRFIWQCWVPILRMLQSDLNTLQHWERTWDMEFNPSKCQVISVSRSKKSLKSRYYLHGQSVDSAKYLGVTISKDLSWNSHFENITVRGNRTLGFVKRNIKTKNKKSGLQLTTLLLCYKWSMLRLFGALTRKKNINKIEMLQRYSSVTDMLSNIGWRSLNLRRYDSRIAMFYKIVYGLVAIPVPPYFERTMVQTPIILLLTGRYILLSVITTIHSSQWRLFSWTGYQLISSLIQILTLSNQDSARSTIHSLKSYTCTVFILLLNSSSYHYIIYAHLNFTFLCYIFSLFLLLLTHYAQHIQIILGRGFR